MRDRAAQNDRMLLALPVDIGDELPAPAQQPKILNTLKWAADELVGRSHDVAFLSA